MPNVSLDLVGILALSLAGLQVAITVFLVIASQEVRSRIETLDTLGQAHSKAIESLNEKFEEVYFLGRLMNRWVDIHHSDMENLKGVVDQLCEASKSKIVDLAYKDHAGDALRAEELYKAYRRLALYSDAPEVVLSSIRFLSQGGGVAEFLLALRLYAVVERNGSIQFREREGWSQEDRIALVSCIEIWAKQLAIVGADLRYFYRMQPSLKKL